MKKVAQVFLTIGVVKSFVRILYVLFYLMGIRVSTVVVDLINLITGHLSSVTSFMVITMIVLYIISRFVFGAIIGLTTLKMLKRNLSKKDIMPLAVLSLIFCSPIAGILLVSAPDRCFESENN